MPVPRRWFLLLLITLGFAEIQATPPVNSAPLVNRPSGRTVGVSVSLTTSGYEFEVREIRPKVDPPGTFTPQYIAFGPVSFEASFVLVNHTRNDIAFQMSQESAVPGASATGPGSVIFRVYDSSGTLVWSSGDGSVLPTPQTAALPAGSALRGSTQVPLQVNGEWLKGDYTLVAAVNGTPDFSATAAFRVSSTPPSSQDDVQGQVFEGPISPVARPGQPSERPLAKAIVRYRNNESAAAFQEIVADDQGRFSFNVPAGTYTVTAIIPGDQGSSFGHGSQQVTVDGVNVTHVTFHLDTGIR